MESLDTQVTIGFCSEVPGISAEEISSYLERHLTVCVRRCRLKKSWTPLNSYPVYEVLEFDAINDDYEKVEPHAFVHLDSVKSAKDVCSAGKTYSLVIRNVLLKVEFAPGSTFKRNQKRRTCFPLKISNVLLDVGSLVNCEKFTVAWSQRSTVFDFSVDSFDKRCRITFERDTTFAFKDMDNHAVIRCEFKLEFRISDVNMVRQYRDDSSLVITLNLSCSPLLYYRTAEDDIHDSGQFDLLDDDDPWIRTTDFTPTRAIGRCNSYRICIINELDMKKAVESLKEQEVECVEMKSQLEVNKESQLGNHRHPFFCVPNNYGFSFNVEYMLNVVLHKGIISCHQFPDSFFYLLQQETRENNIAALKHIYYSAKSQVFDATKRLKEVQQWLRFKNPMMYKLPETDVLVEIRRLIIIPTRAYCLPPELEVSNRVLREYKNVSDKFLRVTFMDDGMQRLQPFVLSFFSTPRVTTKSLKDDTTVLKRIRSIMEQGFSLCGRKYIFLAFSVNQLRHQSAWFFAGDMSEVDGIVKWMGNFDILNTAKAAARMGQCFSCSYATVSVPESEFTLTYPDVERNNYVFSDGIGMITSDLASKVAENCLQLQGAQPCAYQIRFAGCKGVVACWPERMKGIKLCLRRSMVKFISSHYVLEVCSWSRSQPLFLNRQIITLLSALKVPDNIFLGMQTTMIKKLKTMLECPRAASDLLMECCGEEGRTAAVMLSSGFCSHSEPHLRGMLTCIRAAQMRDLKEKARIVVPQGRLLMGCFDEMGTLKQGECFIQVSNPSKEKSVIKGLVIIAKNPCLHPGDVRVLEAVDADGLHNLFDCVVFPQLGVRPHADEVSGSDLDGDLYFVAWDTGLIPPEDWRNMEPMDYTPAPAVEEFTRVTRKTTTNYFINNMVSVDLGTISNAHVVVADKKPNGAFHEDCIELAKLAAVAVDAPKTGVSASLPPKLKPTSYPDFMGKDEWISYQSERVLGKLYRDSIMNSVSSSIPIVGPEDVLFDEDLQIVGHEDHLAKAWELKCDYDGQLHGLLSLYGVKREEEIVTGQWLSTPSVGSESVNDLNERLKHVYNALRKVFRGHFHALEGPDEDLERKASAWYVVTYRSDFVEKSLKMREVLGSGEEEMISLLLSFAWIPAEYLGRIKMRMIKTGRKSGGDEGSIKRMRYGD